MIVHARKKLKIAQLTPYYWPHIGGVEGVVQYLSEGLVRRGHEIHVMTTNRNQKGRTVMNCPQREQINCVNVHRFHAYAKLGHPSFFPGIISPLMRQKFDILHSHCYRHPHGEIARLVGRCRNIPTILHGHGGFFPSSHVKRVLYGLYDQFAKKRFLNQFDHYIALTDFDKEKFVALGVDETKVRVIPNGANDECFEKVNPIPFREKYGLNGKNIILYLGSLNPSKRPDLLIQALPKIVAKVPDAFLLLVGPDAGEYAKVKKIASNLKVCSHFKWIGPLRGKDKHQVFAAADFLALPSDEDSFPLVLLEAMAHAKPVIGSDAVGPSEIIDNNITGFIIRRGNIDDIVNAALKLLTNPMMRERMGRKAREVVIAKYRISRVVDQVENLYYRLVCSQK